MTDAKRLLEQATPLPWMAEQPDTESPLWLFAAAREGNTALAHFGVCRGGPVDSRDTADARLILHAVNRLPDYEAALDALEALLATSATYRHPDAPLVLHQARAALACLRDEVPA